MSTFTSLHGATDEGTTAERHPSAKQSLSQAGFSAFFSGAAVVPLHETGFLRVTGEDRVRWLNGMVTNSIQALASGDGCYNFLLNAQGRIQGTAFAFAEADSLLLETDQGQVAALLALLDRFIIMDDVELQDVSGVRVGILLAGPQATEFLCASTLMPEAWTSSTAAAHAKEMTWQGEPVRVQRMPGKLVPRYELWAAPELAERLTSALIAEGAVRGDAESLECLRLVEGTPKFGVDIRDRELPQETGQAEALHFSKGCYLGQEIVERIRSRGNVHRTFTGFALTGELPAVGAVLSAAGKPIGELTSAIAIPPFPGRPEGLSLGLGYIRREALDSRQPITYEGGTAQPLPLPIRPGEGS